MIKKYYIPTSTLNFNNILSSESISPKAFYEKRNFGYSRWTVIPENNLENAITLYDSLCYFERPQSDLEDHALLVEVELEEYDVKPLGEGVFYCDKTIYLTPSSTRFIFFSERVKKIALSISNGSLETKMIRLYFNSICFVNQPTKSYLVKATDNVQIELNDKEIKKDFQTNKMKGLLYGYYIGSALSTTKENVKRLSCLFEIQNIFSAIRSSIDGKAKDFQAKQLDDLFDKICFSESESKELAKIFKEESLSDMEKLDRLRFFSSKRERWENKKFDCLLQLQNLSENEEDVNPAIEWIEKEIKEQKGKIWREKVVLKTDSDEILVIDSLLNTIKNEYLKDNEITSLFKDWTNDIFASEKYNGKISIFKKEIADEVTTKAKKVIGEEKWPEHQAKKYLNMLRHHIAGESLNYTWEDGVLSSLFSVILAGEEWDKMLKFMQRKEMTDYRLAFAIYGTLNGFANLTRDFTDILLNLDEVYVKDVYKEFYGQLFSRDCGKIDLTEPEINRSIPKIQSEQNSSTKDVEVGNNIKETEQGTPQKNNEETIEAPINHQPIKKNCGEGTIQPSEPQCLKDIFNSSEFKSLQTEAQNWYKNESPSLWRGKNDKSFKNAIQNLSKKCPYPQTTETWDKCVKMLDAKKKSKKNNTEESSLNMFEKKHTIVKLECSRGLDTTKLRQLIYYYDCAQKKHPNNKEELIRFFINLCKKEGRGGIKSSYEALNGYFTDEVAKKYEEELRNKIDIYDNI
ncbi:MAG: hypothetical protein U0L74_07800 [Paludibacteraceae bacterium]|nr:hypothetical protein [Paludibacteraceae bacterium]